MQHKFKGLGVAMVTPFLVDGNVDFPGLTSLTEYLIKGGVDYLVVQGTTGESATMNLTEKQEVLEHVKKINAGEKTLFTVIEGKKGIQFLPFHMGITNYSPAKSDHSR